MKIEKDALLGVVNGVAGAAAKTFDPDTNRVIFHEGFATCFDGIVEASTKCDFFDRNFKVDLPTFRTFLERVKEGELDIAFEENCIVLKQGRLRAKITTFEFDTGILLPTSVDGIEWGENVLTAKFWECTKACLRTVSGKEAPMLDNINWNGSQRCLYSTDKFAATRAELPIDSLDTLPNDVGIPSKVFDLALAMNAEAFGYSDRMKFVFFKAGNCVVGSATYSKYPPIDGFFHPDDNAVEVEFPPMLPEILTRASTFLDKSQRQDFVTLKSDGNVLNVHAQSSVGEFDESIRTIGQSYELPCQVSVISPLIGVSDTVLLDDTKLVFIKENITVSVSLS